MIQKQCHLLPYQLKPIENSSHSPLYLTALWAVLTVLMGGTYQLKPRDVEQCLFMRDQLLQRQKRKCFLYRIVIGDKKKMDTLRSGVRAFRHCLFCDCTTDYDNPKRRKSWGKPSHVSTSSAKPNIHGSKLLLCIWWDQIGVVYYELLKPKETITGYCYRLISVRLSRTLKEKLPLYEQKHDKVILQHDNARPHVAKPVKTCLETLKLELLPHPPYSPDIAPSDYNLFRSMASLSSTSILMKMPKNGSSLG
ncbi:Mariner Mos1 transposase [Araneus ventricosus]|uniref:Mariner Mos1 transposase n=1 Tax=Araneus ventricosus TaxID=182803 RepID=A0A4Y2BE43_ARAVE|nr:Mariner Mos1 transposase [Araneus ventricosus]